MIAWVQGIINLMKFERQDPNRIDYYLGLAYSYTFLRESGSLWWDTSVVNFEYAYGVNRPQVNVANTSESQLKVAQNGFQH